jgi:hypothetical protein
MIELLEIHYHDVFSLDVVRRKFNMTSELRWADTIFHCCYNMRVAHSCKEVIELSFSQHISYLVFVGRGFKLKSEILIIYIKVIKRLS